MGEDITATMAENKEVPSGNMCQLKYKSEKGYLKVKGFCLMDYVTCYHHSELLPKENSHDALDHEYLKVLIQWKMEDSGKYRTHYI